MSRHEYRFYAPDLSQTEVSILGPEVHHAVNVLRLAGGAEVELFDGRGKSAVGVVHQANRGELVVRIDRLHQAKPIIPPIRLCCALPKGSRLDWLLEKMTELGAESFRPVIFERSQAKSADLSDHKKQRWLAICVAAAKQSGLDFLPRFEKPLRLEDLARQMDTGDSLKLMGEADVSSMPLAQPLAGHQKKRPIMVLIGPEGGLSESEKTQARSAGFAPVCLVATTLRIETAAIAMLAGIRAICQTLPDE